MAGQQGRVASGLGQRLRRGDGAGQGIAGTDRAVSTSMPRRREAARTVRGGRY